MPRHPWPLWALTICLIVGFPTLNWVYWPLFVQSANLPPEGDSPIIVMMGGVIVAIIAAPVMIGGAALCLRRYNPKSRLLAFRRERMTESILLTLVFGAPALGLLLCAALQLSEPHWFEQLWTAYWAALAYWLLALRAALLERRDHRT
jgi:amino acid transporter